MLIIGYYSDNEDDYEDNMKNENINVVKMINKDVKFSEVSKEVSLNYVKSIRLDNG